MNKYEILAPAGAKEQLKAAVICGADAVYLGAGNFNARRNADNFSEEDLKEAVKYCHLRNVKVYVTLNTLVFDKEADELYSAIEAIAGSGADAVIVQDFAVAEAVKKICPQMPLHASTQMAVHNASGALFLQEKGFSRIVLARELSFEEIKIIREKVSAELEVFVHGAHCMGASGNCYLSAMLGERSGNRGLCAQGCRLQWKSQHGREYALSLKDMSYLDSINQLTEIGVDSFKIEGRMKRPEYVAAAVTSLKNVLDNKSYDKETLRSVFSRNGFTDGYLMGNRDLSMFGFRGKDDVTSASNVLKSLEALYQKDVQRKKAEMTLELRKGSPAKLTAVTDDKCVSVTGDVPEEPRNAPLSEEIAHRNLSKLGNTPFCLQKAELKNPDNLTLSASSINAMRRDAIEKLSELLTENTYEITSISADKSNRYFPLGKTKTRARFEKLSQYSEIFDKCEFIILPIDEILDNKDSLFIPREKIIAELPELIYPKNEEAISKKLQELKKIGINNGSAGNIGAVRLLQKEGFKIHGAHGLNVTNTAALEYYKSCGLKDTTLSFELSEKDIKNLSGTAQRGIYVYGYLPVMLMRACPQKDYSGCGSCKAKTYLTDRKGIKFPMICRNRKYSVLLNSVPMYVGNKILPSLDFVTLYFTIEAPEKCAEIYDAFRRKDTIEGKKTNGLYSRELL